MLYDWPPVSFSTIMSMVGIGGIINYPLIDWEDTAYIFNHWWYFCFRRIHTLIGHRGEISNAQFNFDSSFIVTGSMVFVSY